MIIKPGSPDENDEELEFIAYAIEEEESMTSSAYPNYKNSILSLDRIRDITEDLSLLDIKEGKKLPSNVQVHAMNSVFVYELKKSN